MVCTVLRLLLFRLAGSQSVSGEGRGGGRAVDYAVGKAIHQRCRRVVGLMISSPCTHVRSLACTQTQRRRELMSAVSQRWCQNIIPPSLFKASVICAELVLLAPPRAQLQLHWQVTKAREGLGGGVCIVVGAVEKHCGTHLDSELPKLQPIIFFFSFFYLKFILKSGSHRTLRHFFFFDPFTFFWPTCVRLDVCQ